VTTTVTHPHHRAESGNSSPSWLARLGSWTGSHLRIVLLAWLVVLAVFGAFARRVESALSGAGWQDSSSSSVKARDMISQDFIGLNSTALQVVVHDGAVPISSDPAARQTIARRAPRSRRTRG
jgi:RND superfamily putative drug exporter